MKIDNTEVAGLKNAMLGMRLPMKSKGDTKGHLFVKVGEKDLKLAKTLAKAGASHGKYLRQIFVSAMIKAPIFWWKEADQYKVGTTTNSESTMHKLADTPITQDCFEYPLPDQVLRHLEALRIIYKKTGDKNVWLYLVNDLPCGWLQTRLWTANYAVLRNIYHQRKGHKLPQWKTFLEWIESLPYSELITEVKE